MADHRHRHPGLPLQCAVSASLIAQHVRHRFPWVNMVMLSELAAFGPSPAKAVEMPGAEEIRLCEMAARHACG
ncbi:hypothetical protein [Cupriavidus necator]|uniref:hypothetical protein n=1 Tax=Cupriavidus necator TaxID=106590 RepID=UPI00339D3740